jgi:spermidine/putrescine-binding protein
MGKRALLFGAVAFAATAAYATAASAQSQQQTPRGFNWSYDKDGKRIPKPSSRVTNADGSWREVVRQGKCITIKEKTAAGEYRETQQCNGQ